MTFLAACPSRTPTSTERSYGPSCGHIPDQLEASQDADQLHLEAVVLLGCDRQSQWRLQPNTEQRVSVHAKQQWPGADNFGRQRYLRDTMREKQSRPPCTGRRMPCLCLVVGSPIPEQRRLVPPRLRWVDHADRQAARAQPARPLRPGAQRHAAHRRLGNPINLQHLAKLETWSGQWLNVTPSAYSTCLSFHKPLPVGDNARSLLDKAMRTMQICTSEGSRLSCQLKLYRESHDERFSSAPGRRRWHCGRARRRPAARAAPPGWPCPGSAGSWAPRPPPTAPASCTSPQSAI